MCACGGGGGVRGEGFLMQWYTALLCIRETKSFLTHICFMCTENFLAMFTLLCSSIERTMLNTYNFMPDVVVEFFIPRVA